MADISKCRGTDCPLKENCYRFTAPINEFAQSYFTEVPYSAKTKSCNYFWITEKARLEAKKS